MHKHGHADASAKKLHMSGNDTFDCYEGRLALTMTSQYRTRCTKRSRSHSNGRNSLWHAVCCMQQLAGKDEYMQRLAAACSGH
eukprot:6072774-Pyramimonas_sp.AAC.1